MSTTDVTLSGALRFQAAREPEREAIVDTGAGGLRAWTYAELDAAVDELAAGLAAIGVGPGDRVALRLANSAEFVLAMLATLRAGGVIVPTIRQYAADELRFALEDCEARCLVFDDEERAPIEAAVPSGTRVLHGVPGGDLADLRGDPGWQAPALDEAEDALIFYTSGTTSRPKGVVLSHRATLAMAQGNAEGWRFGPSDRSYLVLPLFHCNAMFFQLLPVLISGATAVLAPRYSASAYLDDCRRHRITHANLTAGPARSLLAQPEREDDRDHELRLLTFSLPLQGEEIERLETRFGVPLWMAYGLTETAAGGIRSPLHLDPRAGWQSMGRAQLGWEVRIADEQGEPLPDGEIGEILLRGPALLDRYWNQPERTAEALRGGWLHTGDLGWAEPGGFIYFHSREKDMLKPKGENVAAVEIELALEQHPAVSEAAVVGVPDPHQEERVIAVLVGSGCDDEELKRHCGELLAAFKVPSELIWVEDLPKTSVGKINKGQVRALLEARAG